MKKLLTFLLALVMILALAGCDYLPEDLQSTINGALDSIGGFFGGNTDDPEHTHSFVVYESEDATCTEDGYAKSRCVCGEAKEEVLTALGHDMQYSHKSKPSCVIPGTANYKCSRCSHKEKETLEPLGHLYPEDSEASRFKTCTRLGCDDSFFKIGQGGKYAEDLTFTFGDEEKAALEAKHNELKAILEAADGYDEALHGFAEEGDLADAYAAAEAIYEEYSDLIFAAQGQYSVAMTLYYCDHENEELEKTYNDMQTFYTDLVAKFYSLSQPWYDSMFREFFFEGATEEEIKAFLFDSNALANKEYTNLKNRNDEIELEFNGIADPASSLIVPKLYAEFVTNGNAMAKLLGYENYLEYAYKNVYDRDYTPEDVANFVNYFKEYIIPLYNHYYNRWANITANSQDDINKFYGIVLDSFFEKRWSNEMLNNYIDDMGLEFNSNPDKQISFSDELNKLMSDGNVFRGTYEGAYVTYVYGPNIPIAYFGEGYDSTMTIAHEFGHYMNEVYNNSEYNQSYDLLETHSQGNEALYVHYVGQSMNNTTPMAFNLVRAYYLYSSLATIVNSVMVDCFEQAVYLNSYDGYNYEEIMDDGGITADEYDLLYRSIAVDLGICEEARNDEDAHIGDYWRYGMTISSPCYYISYAVSGINALQIYTMTSTDANAAKESYLKLFTYTDEDPEMTDSQILEYAGMLSYKDEQVYKNIYDFLKK